MMSDQIKKEAWYNAMVSILKIASARRESAAYVTSWHRDGFRVDGARAEFFTVRYDEVLKTIRIVAYLYISDDEITRLDLPTRVKRTTMPGLVHFLLTVPVADYERLMPLLVAVVFGDEADPITSDDTP